MSYFRPGSKAEVTDRLAELTGVAVGLAALIYAINVVQGFAAPAVVMTLDAVQVVGGLAILGVYLPLTIWFKTRFAGVILNPWKSDGFMGAALKRAGLFAFSATVVFMIVLSMLNRLVLSRISSETLLDLVLAVALLVFAVCFFLFGRDGAEGEG
jgi:predicted neutral ceramidase superfamily lipid hydrolase